MTEYDYSPEGYQRYLDTQRRISRWVKDTNAHSAEYQSPFGTTTVVSTTKESLRSPAQARANENHGSTSAGGTRSSVVERSRRNSMSHTSKYDPGGTRELPTTDSHRRTSSSVPSHRYTYPYPTQAQALPVSAGVNPTAGPVYAHIQTQRRSQSHSPRPHSSSQSRSHRRADDSRTHSHKPKSHSSSHHHSHSHGHSTPTRSSTLPSYYVSDTVHHSSHKSPGSRSHSTPRPAARYTIQPVSGITSPSATSPTYVVTHSHGKPIVVGAPESGYTIIPPKGKSAKVIYV